MAGRLALEGYDAVTLVEQERPVSGSPDHTCEWSGREWRFTSEQNLRRFEADPSRYAPAYNGQCAFATSLGKEAPGSPRHFRLIDGRLYLQSNAVARFLFGLLPGRVQAADEHWAARGNAAP